MAVRRANEDPNGYVFLGHTQTLAGDGQSMFVMRVDPLGNPIWTKTYGSAPGRSFYPKAEIRSCGSGYIIAGSVFSVTEGGDLGYLARINDAGDLLWMKFYSQVGVASNYLP